MPTTLDFTTPHVLRNKKEYDAAVREIDALVALNAREGTIEDDRLNFLAVLVEAYEDEHEPVPQRSAPQEIVDFMLEQKGMTRADLAAHMGGRGRVSDFFTGRRAALSVNQIRSLSHLLGISADLLMGPGDAEIHKAAPLKPQAARR